MEVDNLSRDWRRTVRPMASRRLVVIFSISLLSVFALPVPTEADEVIFSPGYFVFESVLVDVGDVIHIEWKANGSLQFVVSFTTTSADENGVYYGGTIINETGTTNAVNITVDRNAKYTAEYTNVDDHPVYLNHSMMVTHPESDSDDHGLILFIASGGAVAALAIIAVLIMYTKQTRK